MASDTLAAIFEQVQDPLDAWNSKGVQKELREAEARWLLSKRHWINMLTLTFRDPGTANFVGNVLRLPMSSGGGRKTLPPPVTADIATRTLGRLIRELNIDAFGNHYTRRVGHSYFSYVYVVESQKSGVPHIHMLVDRPINLVLVKALWMRWAGIAHVENVDDPEGIVTYILKEMKYGADAPIPYFSKSSADPSPLPEWWNSSSTQAKQDPPHSQTP